jgi:hypothetical protein
VFTSVNVNVVIGEPVAALAAGVDVEDPLLAVLGVLALGVLAPAPLALLELFELPQADSNNAAAISATAPT